jgi:hypothetical protein
LLLVLLVKGVKRFVYPSATGIPNIKRFFKKEIILDSVTSNNPRVLRSSTTAQRAAEVSPHPPEILSLCFYDAAIRLKENTITEDEYLQAIVAHCTGVRHGKNQLCNSDTSDIRFSNDWKYYFASNVAEVDNFARKVAQFIASHVDKKDNPVHGTYSELRFKLSIIS